MTRKIKFRAWDKEAEKFLYLFGIAWHSPSNWREFSDLQQFTGLRDKNGKEIYEGDIVKFKYLGAFDTVGAVKWSDDAARFFMATIHYPEEHGFPMDNLCQEQEIIGNIYSNPELLR